MDAAYAASYRDPSNFNSHRDLWAGNAYFRGMWMVSEPDRDRYTLAVSGALGVRAVTRLQKIGLEWSAQTVGSVVRRTGFPQAVLDDIRNLSAPVIGSVVTLETASQSDPDNIDDGDGTYKLAVHGPSLGEQFYTSFDSLLYWFQTAMRASFDVSYNDTIDVGAKMDAAVEAALQQLRAEGFADAAHALDSIGIRPNWNLNGVAIDGDYAYVASFGTYSIVQVNLSTEEVTLRPMV